MLNTTAPKHEQARIIGQIQGIYSNASSLLKPKMNHTDFEKAVKEDNISFYFKDIVKKFAADTISKSESETDDIKKSELINNSVKQLSSLETLDIVFDKITKSVFVDVIDIETNSYKDNAVNRLLGRVGNSIQKSFKQD